MAQLHRDLNLSIAGVGDGGGEPLGPIRADRRRAKSPGTCDIITNIPVPSFAAILLAHLADDDTLANATRGASAEVDLRWQQAQAAWPKLHLSAETFAELLATKLVEHRVDPGELASLCMEDLYLASACAAGESEALAAFETEVLVRIHPTLIRRGTSAAEADDTLQTLRERLFVGDGVKPPKISEYNGLGHLYSWARISAIRILQNRQRSTQREVAVDSDGLWETLLPAGDSELEHIKSRYRQDFRTALATAVNGLEDRDRLLLKQHFVDGLPSGQLATLHQVHRATVSRWIVAAQQCLLDSTRHQLMDQLAVTRGELDSILRLIQSQFDTGIGDLLG